MEVHGTAWKCITFLELPENGQTRVESYRDGVVEWVCSMIQNSKENRPMVWKDVLHVLRGKGFAVTEAQVRWAINSGRIDRPPLDGSLRFVFSHEHVEQLKALFRARQGTQCS